MNRTLAATIAIGIACTAGGAAFADDITIDPHPFVSTVSRVQVQEELAHFRKAGVNTFADDYNQLTTFRSSLTRAEVTAQFLASRESVAAFSSEDSGSTYLARSRMAPPRATEFARAE